VEVNYSTPVYERPRLIRVRWVPETIDVEYVFGRGDMAKSAERRISEGTMLWQKAVVEALDGVDWTFIDSPIGVCLDPPGSRSWKDMARTFYDEALTEERIRVRSITTEGTEPEGPCLFCGKHLTHFNNGGDGWVGGSLVDQEQRLWMYCHEGCENGTSHAALWRCYCAAGYVQNAGHLCHECGCLRVRAVQP